MTNLTPEEQEQLLIATSSKIAFIIEGKVIDILYTDARLAAIFLSQPTIVDVSVPEGEALLVKVGWDYNDTTQTFSEVGPYPSWVNTDGVWNAPAPLPNDGATYHWDEANLSWVANGF